MILTKQILEFLYLSEPTDVILTLESIVDFKRSETARDSDSEIIAVSFADSNKEKIVASIKQAIESGDLNTGKGLIALNSAISRILRGKEHIERADSTHDKVVNISDKTPNELEKKVASIKSEKGIQNWEIIENASYLSSMEKQALLSVMDPSIPTPLLDDISVKARKRLYNIALRKRKLLSFID